MFSGELRDLEVETGLAMYPDLDVLTGLLIDERPVVWDVRAVPTGVCRDRAVPTGEVIEDDGLLDPPAPAPAAEEDAIGALADALPLGDVLPLGDILPLGVVACFGPWAVRDDSRPVAEPWGVGGADTFGVPTMVLFALRAEDLPVGDGPRLDMAPG